MTTDKRLNQITRSLTPKQTVVLWLQEIEQYRNAEEYLRYLRSQPESAAPITRLTRQIDEGIRVAMKGKPKEVVDAAVRQAVKDVVFLIKFHLQVNYKVMNESRIWRLQQIALAEALRNMRTECLFRNIIVDFANNVNYQTPYPLAPDIADAVKAAIQHHVYTWETLHDEEIIEVWLWDYFISNGAKEIPFDAYDTKDGKYYTTINDQNEKEVRACFSTDEQFELFRSVKDYSHGLAGIIDAEYNEHYDGVVSGIQQLIDSGQVKEVTTVSLETVPIPFLKEAPLVDGKWLDGKVLELAEMGAMLQSRSYQLKDDDNQNILANMTVIGNGDKEVDQAEVQMFQRLAIRKLKKFTGRTRRIDGRLYINFADYCNWQGRAVKGDLQEKINEGLVTASWNKWVTDNGGKDGVNIKGVPVETLNCGADDGSYYACRNVDEQLRTREGIIKDMRFWHQESDWKKELITTWKDSMKTCLVELYAVRKAFSYIIKGYFDSQQMLFSDLAKEMDDIITSAETTVNNFNEFFVELMKLSERIDIEALRQNGINEANPQIAYLVDMAKAHALDAMGEEDAATQIVERYL